MCRGIIHGKSMGKNHFYEGTAAVVGFEIHLGNQG